MNGKSGSLALLIGSGVGFTSGFIKGIFMASNAPEPKELIINLSWEIFRETISSFGFDPNLTIVIGIIVGLIFVALRIYEILVLITSGILAYSLGILAAMSLLSNNQILIWIGIAILFIAKLLGWLDKWSQNS
jgi:chromate transport protein ChrA